MRPKTVHGNAYAIRVALNLKRPSIAATVWAVAWLVNP